MNSCLHDDAGKLGQADTHTQPGPEISPLATLQLSGAVLQVPGLGLQVWPGQSGLHVSVESGVVNAGPKKYVMIIKSLIQGNY